MDQIFIQAFETAGFYGVVLVSIGVGGYYGIKYVADVIVKRWDKRIEQEQISKAADREQSRLQFERFAGTLDKIIESNQRMATSNHDVLSTISGEMKLHTDQHQNHASVLSKILDKITNN